MDSFQANIKIEVDDIGGEVDVARGRFESALLELFHKDDISESENESDSDQKDSLTVETADSSARNNAILPNVRPVRKRRRKETELRDGGFHHTFVMRMFDRSVDLAQQEPGSPYRCLSLNDIEKERDEVLDIAKVTSLPLPDPWLQSDESIDLDPRIPKPLPKDSLKLNQEEIHASPDLLLNQNLLRWRVIRNQWRRVGQRADKRYKKSYAILKAMFDRQGENSDFWNNLDERKENTDELFENPFS
ncbi:Protein lin-37-like protein [Armadillidium nasatum]|uniref:Protein lin-37-like protein n=1 Tax=Armadillidium nasatum TaxID=96803 RepID=A0A5N5SNV3_9CRUS|nr:Protein lin-37-like protein [Armadillidium nasatum]